MTLLGKPTIWDRETKGQDMPIRMRDPDSLLELIQSANAGNSQTVADSPEERQTHE